MKSLVLVFFSAFLFCSLQAQDAHFSQNTPGNLLNNPAMMGVINGPYRVSAAYRNQWNTVDVGQPFRTIYGSFDSRIISNGDQTTSLNGALMVMNDKAGDLGFGTRQIEAGIGAAVRMSEIHGVSLAAMGGLGQKSLDFSAAQFGNQYDGLGYDPTINSGESLADETVNYLNLSAGLLYFVTPSQRASFYLGGAMYNITSPDITFTDYRTNLASRLAFQLGGSAPVADRVDALGSAQMQFQQSYRELTASVMGRYIFMSRNRNTAGERAFSLGPGMRMSGGEDGFGTFDALIFMARIDYETIQLGLSYDINMSEFDIATANRGGFEVSFVYTGPYQGRNQPAYCPRF